MHGKLTVEDFRRKCRAGLLLRHAEHEWRVGTRRLAAIQLQTL